MSATATGGYLTAEAAGVRNDIVVLPCGSLSPRHIRVWTREQLAPCVSYMPGSVPAGRLFGGFLWKPVRSAGGAFLDPYFPGFAPPGALADWDAWIKELFAPRSNLHALAELAGAGAERPDVWIGVPYPHPFQERFGSVNGRPLSFRNEADRGTAVEWWMRRFLSAWNASGACSSKLRLQGFVWPRTSIAAADAGVARRFAAEAKALRVKPLWLTNYGAPGMLQWKELGFQLVAVHSNYTGVGSFGREWIANAGAWARTERAGLHLVIGRGPGFAPQLAAELFAAGAPAANGYIGSALKVYSFPNQPPFKLRQLNPDTYARLHRFINGR